MITTPLLLLDILIPHLHKDSDKPEGLPVKLSKTTMMLLAVTLHNIPEAQAGEHSNIGTIGAAIGFALMMVLDVALG